MNYKIPEHLGVCVLVPTYNNAKTLKRVLDGLQDMNAQVIVINDGSTDSTRVLLNEYTEFTQIHFTKNRGKGIALRMGFKRAFEDGFKYAITIDSDGQHFPHDIPVFLDSLQKDGQALLVGARNMTHDSVPRGSSFGNRFSNFWFWIETGVKMIDTQCGYRLYPLEPLSRMRFFTSRFEFEIEVLVKAAWREIPVKNVPIQVLYDPDERVSHFRPFTDFFRISLLNTYLVFIAFIFILPKKLLKSLFF